jgi:signal transduction histidine kinase
MNIATQTLEENRLRTAWVLRAMALASLLLFSSIGETLTSPLFIALAAWLVMGTVSSRLLRTKNGLRLAALFVVCLDSAFGLIAVGLTGWLSGSLWWALLVGPIVGGLLLPWSWTLTISAGALCVAIAGPILQNGLANTALVPLGGRALGILSAAGALSGILQGIYPEFERLGRNGSGTLEAVRAQERARTNWLFRAGADINATLNVDEVIEQSLELCEQALASEDRRETRLCSALVLLTEQGFNTMAVRGLDLLETRLGFSAENGALSRALVRGEAQMIYNPDLDPDLAQIPGLNDCQEVLIAPLAYGLETYGSLLFGHPESSFFSRDKRDLLVSIAKQITIALQNARLYQNLEVEKERITELQEEARKKLARDLHDGPTQTMAAITMRINFARRLMERDPQEAEEELTRVEGMARSTTREIRHMLFTLRPLILETQGLVIALYQLAEKVRETHSQKVTIDADPELVQGMDLGRQGVLFYIAEEAINNARKHAMAENIWVRLRRDRDNVSLEVEDDGVGFNLGAVDSNYEQRGSLGIVSMRERAELVAGTLHIESAEGRGTRVALYVPFGPQNANDMIEATVGRELDD